MMSHTGVFTSLRTFTGMTVLCIYDKQVNYDMNLYLLFTPFTSVIAYVAVALEVKSSMESY